MNHSTKLKATERAACGKARVEAVIRAFGRRFGALSTDDAERLASIAQLELECGDGRGVYAADVVATPETVARLSVRILGEFAHYVAWSAVEDERVRLATVVAVVHEALGKPLYRASWDEAFVKPGSEIVTEDFFCPERCYSEVDRLGIQALATGKTWMSADYGRAHTVTRIC